MSDFRVDTFFFRHNKTKRLHRMLGYEGVFALMKLWAYASDCKYDGDHVFTADDIELAVDWEGQPGELVAALASCDPYICFIDAVDGGYLIHDWEEHNCYAATAGSRTDAARNAANIRWKKKRGVGEDAKEKPHNATACDAHDAENAGGNADASTPHDADDAPSNAPAPSPVPSPVPSPSPSPSPSPIEKDLKASCKRDPPAPSRMSTSAPGGAAHARKNFHQNLFEKFWTAFDDKRGKTPAWNAWRAIKGLDEQLAATIIAGARAYAEQRAEIVARKGTPKMAQGWLSDRRWEDDTAVAGGAPLSPTLSAAFSRVMEVDNGHV